MSNFSITPNQQSSLSPWEQAEQELACDHDLHLVAYPIATGLRLVQQCRLCGERVGGFLKQAGIDLESLPRFDEAARDARYEARRKRADELYNQRKSSETNAWFDEYDRYLASPHWKQLRRRVLVRDGFRCQDCFGRVTDATAHVHHTSYDAYKRLGYSFAFECVTLCPSCHSEFHGEQLNNE